MAIGEVARRRFAREARTAATVSNEHVVTIHAVDELDGLPYLVMEFIFGESLKERLDRTGFLQLTEIVRIGMEVAAGLAAAHDQGLIHRDIKPSNILLEDRVERVKITDFGLARAVDDTGLTQSGVLAGTPEYMAPEQARSDPLDHRADLFSLGSVLYAMCTGRSPFRASGTLAVLRRVCEDAPRPIKEINPDIPVWLVEIIAKLHCKDPSDRFQSASEVAGLLRRHLAHLQQPLLIPRPRGLNLDHLPRRGFNLAALICGLGVVTVGVITLTGWVTRQPLLMGVRESYIPMAPNTAAMFLLLGMGLLAVSIADDRGIKPREGCLAPESRLGEREAWRFRGCRLASLSGIFVALICVVRLVEYAAGRSFAVDSWYVRTPAGMFGGAPIGKIGLFTAIASLGASLALAILAWSRRTKDGELLSCAGAGATIAGAIGLVFALGYLFNPNAPLLYGSEAIPMALNTALGFILLATGEAAVAGPGAFPFRRLAGPTVRARMLRVFLPLVVGTVVVVAWLTHFVSTSAGGSTAAVSSAAMATLAMILVGFICDRAAGHVGERIERAEEALRKAHDDLEDRIAERTRELVQAKALLERRNRELQQLAVGLNVKATDQASSIP